MTVWEDVCAYVSERVGQTITTQQVRAALYPNAGIIIPQYLYRLNRALFLERTGFGRYKVLKKCALSVRDVKKIYDNFKR